MTTEEILILQQLSERTARMRELQKEYFRTRSTTVLADAKKAEKEVDATLVRLRNHTNDQTLF